MNKKVIGAILVSMAASSVMASDAPAAKADAKTEYSCQNNSCKGKSDCMGFGNDSCKGSNACKNQGSVSAKTKEACEKKHGLWTAKK